MTDFTLDPRLAADTAFVADWSLSRVLLMNDARYPWLILVPRVSNAIELLDLAPPQRATLMDEVTRTSQTLKHLTSPAKLNIGALGNIVAQLHIHIVARNPGDPAWPGPVWGHSPRVPYADAARDAFIAQLVNTR
ncbi:MAG TPA: HIT family protein [Rhizomicrobium sp.]|jgi:diadenosine tetraphosphate (Ap4A) HIT family hydrolase|nr:HIT family protein [Rhizomicrobium sp.]